MTIEKLKNKIGWILYKRIEDYRINQIYVLLEELRPEFKTEEDKLYIELAEMILDDDITKDIEFRGMEDYEKYNELNNKIKELK